VQLINTKECWKNPTLREKEKTASQGKAADRAAAAGMVKEEPGGDPGFGTTTTAIAEALSNGPQTDDCDKAVNIAAEPRRHGDRGDFDRRYPPQEVHFAGRADCRGDAALSSTQIFCFSEWTDSMAHYGLSTSNLLEAR
jgi:hypothetical protein